MKEIELNKQKLKTLRQLKAAGYDTRKKLDKLDGRAIFKHNLTGEMGNIFDLQDAVKMRKEYDWIMDGVDPEPERKEARKNADDDRATADRVYPETYAPDGY